MHILINKLKVWMKPKKPIIQKRRKVVCTVGSLEEAVVDPKVGLIAILAEELMVKRNAKPVVDKKVKTEPNIHHVDPHQRHAELLVKVISGAKPSNIKMLIIINKID